MQNFQFTALGTHWWIELFHAGNDAGDIEKIVTDQVHKFELDYSRFLDDSLLSQLNRDKQLLNPPAEMVAMIRFALRMYVQTKGLFNISVGAKLEQDGYGLIKDDHARISSDLIADITCSDTVITIAPHVRLDFGGFGKGWLVDAIARLLQDNGYQDFMVNGGGDIYVHASHPVELALEHPLETGMMIGTVPITKGALAASSPHKRTWKKHDTVHHHIVSTGDGGRAVSLAGTFTRANTALMADVSSTVLLLADPVQITVLAKQLQVKYLLVTKDLSVISSKDFQAQLNFAD